MLKESSSQHRGSGSGSLGGLNREKEPPLFGDLLRRRRETLGKSVSELFRLTGVQRSYISDCESSRKFPSRNWVEQLAALPPADPSLVAAFDAAVIERALSMKRPASRATTRLVQELANPSPADDDHGGERAKPEGGAQHSPALNSFHSLTGRTHCLQYAVALLERAADAGPPAAPAEPVESCDTELDTVLLVLSPSLERADLDWQSPLKDAVGHGWTVVHLVTPEEDTNRQIDRVRDLVSLVSRGREYLPLALPRDGSSPDGSAGESAVELIVAPGQGVLQMYANGTAGTYFPWQTPYLEACRNLARGAHVLRAKATRIITMLYSNDPPTVPKGPTKPAQIASKEDTRKWLTPLPAKVVFDEALTDATVKGGRRVLLKSGLVAATMQPYLTLKLAARLRLVATDEQIPLIDKLTENRLRRWNAIQSSTIDLNQHLCTIPAIHAYLAGTDEPDRRSIGRLFVEHDPLFGGMELTQEDRIEHMRGVVELLRSSTQYEVGLVQSPDAVPVPVGKSYWSCTQTALFFVGLPPDGSGTRFVTIRDSAVIEGFFQVFDGAWEAIPAEWRDRKFVADLLEKLIGLAENGNPMMKQPMTYAALG